MVKRIAIFVALGLIASIAIVVSVGGDHYYQMRTSAVYPNELPQYQFHWSATWKKLMPSNFAMADVRGVLGTPDKAYDVAADTEPYPGDEAARKPVFVYARLIPDWYILVYFSKYCFRDHPSDPGGNRICSIELVPKRRLVFSAIKFSEQFTKQHVVSVYGGWDSYTDDSGLQYNVYTEKTPYDNHMPGDLFRISYGLPRSQMPKP
jgi:hypothetical protein